MTDKANLLLHPIRMQIVLVLAEKPLTAQQLGRTLSDIPQATLYRQINQLLQGGLLAIVEERQVHSNTEKVYGLVAGGANLGPEDLASASNDDQRRFFITFIGSLLLQFERYLASSPKVDLSADGVSYNTGSLYLSDAELAQLQADFRTLMLPLIANPPSPERRRRQFATILMPNDPPADTEQQP